jgi:hypothetical protein
MITTLKEEDGELDNLTDGKIDSPNPEIGTGEKL